MNRVILLGHIGNEPELRHTQAGQPVLHFRMATNDTWVDANKERQERTDWHDVVVWGPRGEGLARMLHKGMGVLVEGTLRTSSYEGKDGVKRFRTEIIAKEICFTGKRSGAVGTGADDFAERGARPVAPSARNGAPKRPDIGLNDELPF